MFPNIGRILVSLGFESATNGLGMDLNFILGMDLAKFDPSMTGLHIYL